MAGAGGGGSGDTSPTVVPVPSPIPTRRRPTNGNSRGRDWDRFIPNRSAMDMDYARYMLTEGNRTRGKNPDEEESDYCKILAKVMGQDRRSILSFGPKHPDPLGHLTPTQKVDFIVSDYYRSKKPQRLIPLKPERMFDLPDLLADDSLNLLDWGSRNILAVALADTLHLKVEQHIRELVTIPEDHGGPITSVSWDPDGRSLAVGLNSSDVQLWDAESNRLLRTFSGGHQPHSRVGSLAWKDRQILTSGGMDARVINNDVRTRSHVVQTYQGHAAEVCSLKWSASGTQLASGGNDNLVLIWDSSMASPARTQWLHKLEEHTGAVKGLAWCPFRHNLLASGGGVADHRIKFWNSTSGVCLNTVDTGSQVCSLIWNTKERELLSSHGFPGNQLTLWKYPSMQKLAELSGHTSSVLFMTQSPNGCTVASASAGPETEALMLWNVFGNPEAPQSSQRTNELPFARRNYIR